MSTNEKKGVTVKIDAELHAEVKQYIEAHEMTMADFVTLALQGELHPRLNIQEDKSMGNIRYRRSCSKKSRTICSETT